MQSVDFIPYGAETLALCAALPDWSEPMKLDVELPTDITDSLLKGESRRRFSTSQRYTMSHLFTSDNAADSHDLRAWLERLKVEMVAWPLWMDELELAVACAAGATTLQIDGEAPARYGAEWLVMDETGADFEIVLVTNRTDTTLTLGSPGTNSARPIGTRLYPLAFGRLSERPAPESLSDEAMSCRLTFQESSPYARKLNTRSVPANLFGSHVPDFALYKLWTVEPDWARPMDWTEADILYQKIGFGREEQAYQYQNWNRRGLEMSFTCTSRDEIAEIEYFFSERKANTSPFFIPTFRGDLRLAANVANGATTFQIEESRYEVAAYDHQPWNAFLCFIDDSGIYPQRITEVNLTTITPEVPVGKAFEAATTDVCFLSLVRFVEPKLSWEYLSDNTARTKLKFIELPGEYTTGAPDLRPIAYLYKFTERTPTPTEWYFTSHEDTISFGGHTYAPAPFSHDRYRSSRDMVDPFTLKSWGGDFTGNPLNQYLPFTLNAPMSLTVYRVNRDNPNDTNQRLLYYGDMMSLDATGADWRADFRPFGRTLDMKFPRFLFQIPDNFTQFDAPTELADTSYKKTAALYPVAAAPGNPTGTFTVWANYTAADPVDWFSNGRLDTGTGANFERRSILKSTVGSPNNAQLTLDRPLINAVRGQACTLWPGYDQSRAQCQTKFANNINFGGHPFQPVTNPTIKSQDIKIPKGGKKG